MDLSYRDFEWLIGSFWTEFECGLCRRRFTANETSNRSPVTANQHRLSHMGHSL